MINPDGYRARVELCDAEQLLRHLSSLSREQLRHHLRAVLPKGALQRGAHVSVRIHFGGGGLNVAIDFGPAAAGAEAGSVSYQDRYPSLVHDAMIAAARELAREVGMQRLEFIVRFELAFFSLTPLEHFVRSTRELLGSQLVLRRLLAVHYAEYRERGTLEPAHLALFAYLSTDQDEPVCVELCRTEHPGHQEALLAWAEQRAREASLRLERQRQ